MVDGVFKFLLMNMSTSLPGLEASESIRVLGELDRVRSRTCHLLGSDTAVPRTVAWSECRELTGRSQALPGEMNLTGHRCGRVPLLQGPNAWRGLRVDSLCLPC